MDNELHWLTLSFQHPGLEAKFQFFHAEDSLPHIENIVQWACFCSAVLVGQQPWQATTTTG